MMMKWCVLEDLNLDTHPETNDIFELQISVCEGTGHIEIAGADFVIGGDAFAE